MCQVLLTISHRVKITQFDISDIWLDMKTNVAFVRNQLHDDIANDQLSLFESVDPFTGKKNSKK